ncbi:hemolysin family protein [Methanobrevibacter curvatus]|uniref:Magnesium and cobalt efflux protein CorC n=1 Tax=Methanobrevibacter curvatus TaxID=49547 RepID=A0A166CUB6_9EURY|nr:hemolysin family protein [Methanobrevibacter curvatus]KZX14871.1 magnesium and cobalt efflux protein CorC [Methanobrevibacter curvatus]
MSTNIFLEIIIIIISIIVSAYLVMAEMAIVSSRKVKLQKMLKDGDKRAQIAIDLYDNPNDFLSVVQVGITLISIIIGAVSGASLSDTLYIYLKHVPYGHTIAMVSVIIITTYITLVIGELVPKRAGLNNPEKISLKISRSLKILTKISRPLLFVLSVSTDFILKLIGSYKKNVDVITEDDVKLLIEEGIEDGTIEKDEEEIIRNVFRLDEQKIDVLMTPRTEIIWIDLEDPQEDMKKRVIQSERSIFPVARDELDNLEGVIQAKDILSSMFLEGEYDIEECIKKPIIVPENLQALDLLKKFKENKEYVHMALIVDEHGSVVGLITLNDFLEGLVGDIPGIDETDDPKAIKRSDDSYLIDGSFQIDRFKDMFQISEKLPEEEDNFTTLAGFILSFLDKIPEEGESFTWKNLKFEVLDMDGHHIDKILVKID